MDDPDTHEIQYLRFGMARWRVGRGKADGRWHYSLTRRRAMRAAWRRVRLFERLWLDGPS